MAIMCAMALFLYESLNPNSQYLADQAAAATRLVQTVCNFDRLSALRWGTTTCFSGLWRTDATLMLMSSALPFAQPGARLRCAAGRARSSTACTADLRCSNRRRACCTAFLTRLVIARLQSLASFLSFSYNVWQ